MCSSDLFSSGRMGVKGSEPRKEKERRKEDQQKEGGEYCFSRIHFLDSGNLSVQDFQPQKKAAPFGATLFKEASWAGIRGNSIGRRFRGRNDR